MLIQTISFSSSSSSFPPLPLSPVAGQAPVTTCPPHPQAPTGLSLLSQCMNNTTHDCPVSLPSQGPMISTKFGENQSQRELLHVTNKDTYRHFTVLPTTRCLSCVL